jgi:hypothetical protein
MDKVLVVGLLTIAGVITSLFLFNGLRESVDKTAETNQQTQILSGIAAQTKLQIISARNGDNGGVLDIWIKNTGIVDINPVTIPDLELFLIDVDGKWGEYIDYSSTGPVAGADTWTEIGFADPIWAPGKTLRVRVTLGANPMLATGYRISINTYNNVTTGGNNVTTGFRFQGDPSAVAPIIPTLSPVPASTPVPTGVPTPTPVPTGVPTPTPIPAPTPSGSCSPTSPGAAPILNSVATSIGYPRQMLAINGDTSGASIVWGAGTANETTITTGAGGTRYFQIPDNAAPAIYPVALRVGANTSNIVCVTVKASSGTFPAPRIEDIGLHGRTATDLAFTVAAANLDADATVTVNGVAIPNGTLWSALPVAYQLTHIPATFGYPIYHYAQLKGVIQNPTIGSVLNVVITNHDGQSSAKSYTLPARWEDLDSDSDGLLDRWEDGIYTAPGGGTVNLSAMGVSKYRKDIMVESDWSAVAAPSEGVWTGAVNTFAQAPVLNPDGSSGIDLRVDRGQGGAFTEGGEVLTPHTTIWFGGISGGGYMNFFDYKQTNFNPDRQGLFHYNIFGRGSPRGFSGVAEFPVGGPENGDDFLVSCGSCGENALIGTFLHELGHNLYLSHGGLGAVPEASSWEHNQYRPTTPSIMSYRYQFGGTNQSCNTNSEGLYTFSQGQIKTIDELDTNENVGICDNNALDISVPSDGQIAVGVINSDTSSGRWGTADDTHRDSNQWGNIVIDFRNR